MGVPEEPVAALADEDAWHRRESHPQVLSVGGPAFGVARERERGGWTLLPYSREDAPQQARDTLGSYFRGLVARAREAGDGPDPAETAEYEAAVERLDWEPLDELVVRGERYRVVRVERFTRAGPDGPEPPRPSDPDPGRPGHAHELPDPGDGFVLDTLRPTGLSEGILKAELLQLVPPEDGSAAARCAREAARSHPGGVLLPPEFLVAEEEDGRWRPVTSGSTTPQSARDVLTMDLRVLAPVLRKLDAAERAEYARAADRFDEERGAELRVAGRRLRVVRVERLVRIGPDGPEGPRPSDPDPQPPIMEHDRQLREQGLVDDEEPEPSEPDEEQQEIHRLLELEQERQRRFDSGR